MARPTLPNPYEQYQAETQAKNAREAAELNAQLEKNQAEFNAWLEKYRTEGTKSYKSGSSID